MHVPSLFSASIILRATAIFPRIFEIIFRCHNAYSNSIYTFRISSCRSVRFKNDPSVILKQIKFQDQSLLTHECYCQTDQRNTILHFKKMHQNLLIDFFISKITQAERCLRKNQHVSLVLAFIDLFVSRSIFNFWKLCKVSYSFEFGTSTSFPF